MQKTIVARWQRGWRRKGPRGCLVFIWLPLILSGVTIFLVLQEMKSSEAYTGALAFARESRALGEELGTPVEERWFFTGSIDINEATGIAELSIPLAGPEGSGMMHAIANKRAGQWEFELLEVEIKGREQRLDLLAERH